ncbi:MAG: helix-turn-helix transcriptional regulator [Desulfobacterales bacterium]|nr:helix-turn-helix transcriptional regulator [Desulfobacterales bacterium]
MKRKRFLDYSFLRKTRKECNFTIKQFAEWTETSISNYLRKEQGNVTLTIDEVFQIYQKIKEINPSFIAPVEFATDPETFKILHILNKSDLSTKKQLLEYFESLQKK